MSEFLLLAVALVLGLSLGAAFFGGLWWTVNKSISSKHPALWFLISWLLRMSIALLGFYVVGRDQWQQLVMCLVGFVAARFIVTRLTQPSVIHGTPSTETSRAA